MIENTTVTVSKYTASKPGAGGSLSNARTYKAYFETKTQGLVVDEAGSAIRYDAIMIITAHQITNEGAINVEEDTALIGLNSKYYQIKGVNPIKGSYGTPISHYEYELKLDKRDATR